ncbi:hypothetical protein M422DRAFT_23065 [Sphaerobolus stellatus SS14]|nr:hypothetical protein M422DRAFT_23065 [Sphaerobolus stellatus SS14]
MHPLETILQLQVGSDQAAVLNLPYITASLTPTQFSPSPHLQKWISRIASLIHAKQPGSRWAGLCLALQTSVLNKAIMMEAAQGWVGSALPMLSKSETPAVLMAATRLLQYIFLSAIDSPEFQRQIATPNVPKFSAALITLAEKSDDPELKHLAFTSLTNIVPAYPALHRQLHPSLVSLTFRLLSGSATSPTPASVITDACSLHSVLHVTGGKVGAAAQWRKSLDTALSNAWSAFMTLRTTTPQTQIFKTTIQPSFAAPSTDAVVTIPLSLDRLRCSIALIESLLRAVTARPVPVCAGELSKLALSLLRCTLDGELNTHHDESRRALEASVVPEIWKLGCGLVIQLAETLRHHLSPYLSRILSHILHHLEETYPKKYQVSFLQCLPFLLAYTYDLHSTIPPTRLAKAILPQLTMLLSHKSDVTQQKEEASAVTSSKKGKKRARGYEGDEIFKVGPTVLCPTPEDRQVVLVSLDALDPLIQNPHIAAPIRALAKRLLVTLLLELPKHGASAISQDLAFQGQVYAKVAAICSRQILPEPSGWMNSSAGLVINSVSTSPDSSMTVGFIFISDNARTLTWPRHCNPLLRRKERLTSCCTPVYLLSYVASPQLKPYPCCEARTCKRIKLHRML